jgi:hypothetical protein
MENAQKKLFKLTNYAKTVMKLAKSVQVHVNLSVLSVKRIYFITNFLVSETGVVQKKLFSQKRLVKIVSNLVLNVQVLKPSSVFPV